MTNGHPRPASPPGGLPAEGADAVRASYDAVASAYDHQLGDDLRAKPWDRAVLTAFAELVDQGTIADVGCGPGQVSRFLAELRPDVVGIDLSPGMVAAARRRAPDLSFTVGSMLDLPVADGAWAGVVAWYSIIHLTPEERTSALAELFRVLTPGGRLLVSFHVASADLGPGDVNRMTEWFGVPVQLDGYFLDPTEVVAQLGSAGFVIEARVEREPIPDGEYPSRRCSLLARRP